MAMPKCPLNFYVAYCFAWLIVLGIAFYSKEGKNVPWHLVFMVAAFILFFLAAIGAPWTAPATTWGRLDLVAAGLACLTVAFMLGGMGSAR